MFDAIDPRSHKPDVSRCSWLCSVYCGPFSFVLLARQRVISQCLMASVSVASCIHPSSTHVNELSLHHVILKRTTTLSSLTCCGNTTLIGSKAAVHCSLSHIGFICNWNWFCICLHVRPSIHPSLWWQEVSLHQTVEPLVFYATFLFRSYRSILLLVTVFTKWPQNLKRHRQIHTSPNT